MSIGDIELQICGRNVAENFPAIQNPPIANQATAA
jgi:hypothetical protein